MNVTSISPPLNYDTITQQHENALFSLRLNQEVKKKSLNKEWKINGARKKKIEFLCYFFILNEVKF